MSKMLEYPANFRVATFNGWVFASTVLEGAGNTFCVILQLHDSTHVHTVKDFDTWEEADACALGIIEGLILAQKHL